MKQFYTLILLIPLFFHVDINSQNISTLYGTNRGYSGDDGPASTAQLYAPVKIVFDGNGNLYIAEYGNHIIRKVDNSGIITTIAGTGTAGYSGDSGLATAAELNEPYGIAFDPDGNLFFSDSRNNRIRKIDGSGTITTVAGTGTAGYSGDDGPATSARLKSPYGITFDANNNLYIADTYNHVIRRIDNSSGIITTIAGDGNPDYSGDGDLATSAGLKLPEGVTFNASGELFIADSNNHVIRKIDNSGIISTVAGIGTSSGYSGDGGLATSAQLYQPGDLIFDNDNNFYFSEYGNHTVRKVDNSGIITTIAGTGTRGYSGDGGPATSARLYGPYGLAFDLNGDLLISEYGNSIIRKVSNVTLGIDTYTTNEKN